MSILDCPRQNVFDVESEDTSTVPHPCRPPAARIRSVAVIVVALGTRRMTARPESPSTPIGGFNECYGNRHNRHRGLLLTTRTMHTPEVVESIAPLDRIGVAPIIPLNRMVGMRRQMHFTKAFVREIGRHGCLPPLPFAPTARALISMIKNVRTHATQEVVPVDTIVIPALFPLHKIAMIVGAAQSELPIPRMIWIPPIRLDREVVMRESASDRMEMKV